MTERIDLDDIETESDEPDGEAANHGDWFWRGDGSPDEEPDVPWTSASAARVDRDDPGGDGDFEKGDDATGDDAGADRPPRARVPRVPRQNEDKPVGIPQEGGGAGGASAKAASEGAAEAPRPAGGGPHGGGIDDMAMAITYGAARRLAEPGRVFASASQWSDWIGVVGDVPAHVIQKFQRNNGIDADFFNGTGTGPGERLAEIGPNSMFYAERMVVVGVEGEDEPIAEAAGWEFVPLSKAAEKAGWELNAPARD